MDREIVAGGAYWVDSSKMPTNKATNDIVCFSSFNRILFYKLVFLFFSLSSMSHPNDFFTLFFRNHHDILNLNLFVILPVYDLFLVVNFVQSGLVHLYKQVLLLCYYLESLLNCVTYVLMISTPFIKVILRRGKYRLWDT